MALSDLAKFNEQTYSTLTEVVAQQVEKFNAASAGTIVLRSGRNKAAYSETAMFGAVAGLVRRRDPNSDGAVSAKAMKHIKDVSVKVAGGCPPVLMNPAWYAWIQQNTAVAAAALAQQLAKQQMQDMLNVGISAGYAALAQVAALVFDGSAATFDASYFAKGSRKFGDSASSISGWIMHSSPTFDFYQANIANSGHLFNYGTVNVVRDPFGRVLIVTDSSSLVTVDGVSSGVDKYHTLGLVPGGIIVEDNGDFYANVQETNGKENIERSYQAEWSYQLGVKGFAWDMTNGGAAPSNAALATATNWDKYATENKELAGVVVESR